VAASTELKIKSDEQISTMETHFAGSAGKKMVDSALAHGPFGDPSLILDAKLPDTAAKAVYHVDIDKQDASRFGAWDDLNFQMFISRKVAYEIHMAQDPRHYEGDAEMRDEDRYRFNLCTKHAGAGDEPDFDLSIDDAAKNKFVPECFDCHDFLCKIRSLIDFRKAWAHSLIKGDGNKLDGIHLLSLLPIMELANPLGPVTSILSCILWTIEEHQC